MRGRYLEQYGRLLIGNRCLSRLLVGKCIAPRKGYFDLGEPQLQELELAKILVQEIPS